MPKQNRQDHDLEGYPHQFSPELEELRSGHACQMTCTVREKPPAHDRSYPPAQIVHIDLFDTLQVTDTDKLGLGLAIKE